MRHLVIRGACLAVLGACTADRELGRELEAFCALVQEAQSAHPNDRAARSRYVAERSDSAVRATRLVEVMRRLAVADPGERPEILAQAGEQGGLKDFQCPAVLDLYQ